MKIFGIGEVLFDISFSDSLVVDGSVGVLLLTYFQLSEPWDTPLILLQRLEATHLVQ
jgi:hypothetical protein